MNPKPMRESDSEFTIHRRDGIISSYRCGEQKAMTSDPGGPRTANERLHQAWEKRHPYNFVCLVECDAGVDIHSLDRAARTTLDEFGLGETVGLVRDTAELGEESSFESHALRELNTRVVGAVRVAILKRGDARAARARIAVTYRHLFFDGTNSTVFMRRMLLRACGHMPPKLELGRLLRGRDWLMANGLWSLPGLLAALAWDATRMRSVFARGDGSESPEVEGRFLDHSPGLLARLRREGDRVGATINDVLLARMARAAFAMDVDALRKGNLALSMAVSLRSGLEPLHQGVCVAVAPVYLRRDDDLLRMVRKQTVRMKQRRSYMRSLIGIGIGSRLWRHPETGCRASNSYVPSMALTNMRIPAAAGDELVSRWRRIVSAGPVAPLLVTAITHLDRLEIALSWRKGLFSERDLSLLICSLCD